ncbi:hypothetical protein [Burkholderia lata]|uniref:hypothetical protein n=1 Tax=Burkholderia lata (strain ATCC 17760 / DSM 23089 / LMG 22485 / NCIMB 9086 / R18194 / 383) TaxID=482957 RepID=UPI0015842795|nr:hypothetical protein [Burkholderia lata]
MDDTHHVHQAFKRLLRSGGTRRGEMAATKPPERKEGANEKRLACPARAGPGNPDPALRAADLASAVRRTFFCSSLRMLSGSLHFFLRRAAPLSAQSGPRETFAGGVGVLYQAFGNSLSECLRRTRHGSANLAFTSAFLFNGTGSNR